MTDPSSGSCARQSDPVLGATCHGRMMRAAMANASRPESRTTASALRPGGVARAAMESSAPGRWVTNGPVDSVGNVLEHVSGFENSHVVPLVVERQQRF